jgi:hypothetical protein
MQSVFERHLEGLEQTSTPGNASFERRRSSAASSALHLRRRRRVSLLIASDEPLGSNNKFSARADARANANVGQGHGAGACIYGRRALIRQRRHVRWHHHGHAYHASPTDA